MVLKACKLVKLSQASCVGGRSILKHSEAGTKMDLSVSVKYAEDESCVLTANGVVFKASNTI